MVFRRFFLRGQLNDITNLDTLFPAGPLPVHGHKDSEHIAAEVQAGGQALAVLLPGAAAQGAVADELAHRILRPGRALCYRVV